MVSMGLEKERTCDELIITSLNYNSVSYNLSGKKKQRKRHKSKSRHDGKIDAAMKGYQMASIEQRKANKRI